MANNKSAEKRIKIIKRNRLQNRFYKSSVQSSIKMFLKYLEMYDNSKSSKDKKKVQKNLGSVYSIIDKATKRNIFHKNKAARKKAKLAAYAKSSTI